MDAVEKPTTVPAMAVAITGWLQKPETKEKMDRLSTVAATVAVRLNEALAGVLRSYFHAVDRDKRARLAAALASGNLHRADVDGLRSLGAPDAVIERAARGGRARRRVHLYRQPVDIAVEKLAAFDLMANGKPDATPQQRRMAFETMPFRDEIIHAVASAALDAAGRGNSQAGYEAASKTLSRARTGKMVGTTPSSARKIYRQVARRMRNEGWEKTFEPIGSKAFSKWIEKGVVPASLDDHRA